MKKNIIEICSIYFGIFLIFLFSNENAKNEFFSTYSFIIYFYFIPLTVFVLTRINNWKALFIDKKFLILSDIIIVSSFLSKIFFEDPTDYMIFSYDLLPFWGIVVISNLFYENKKQFIFIIIVFLEAIMFGARGPLLWTVLCAISSYIYKCYSLKNIKAFSKQIIMALLILIMSIIFLVVILPNLEKTKFAQNSYILIRLSQGSLSESNARITIMKTCLDELGDMGININGLYYDRVILPRGMYAHNIVVEVFLSLGWVFGTIFFGFLINIMFLGFRNQDHDGRIAWIYFTCVLFLRYFISGSIFAEGKFIMFLGIMVALRNYKVEKISKEGIKND